MTHPKSGWLLYASVLRGVADGPATAMELAALTKTCLPTMRKLIRRLHAQGLVHIARWQGIGVRNMPVACYGLGAGVDALREYAPRRGAENRAGQRPPPPKPIKPRSEITAFATIIRAMLAGPCTAADLAEFCGINRSFSYSLLRHMRELRLVCIADWAPRMYGGCPAAMYGFAVDGADKPRPKTLKRSVIEAKRTAANRQRDAMSSFIRMTASNGADFHQAA
jgi:DNA-binding IscR family transcriptional regulator